MALVGRRDTVPKYPLTTSMPFGFLLVARWLSCPADLAHHGDVAYEVCQDGLRPFGGIVAVVALATLVGLFERANQLQPHPAHALREFVQDLRNRQAPNRSLSYVRLCPLR